MSHISVTKARITKLNAEIARLAFKVVAEKHGGVFTTIIEDYYGNKAKVVAGMKVGKASIGVAEVNGKVVIMGDKFLWQEKYEEVVKDFHRTYISIAIASSLRNSGYEVEVKELEKGVLIDAYR